jgi:hypothetical protein
VKSRCLFHANVFICVSRQLEKYKAIEGKTVAKAMFKIAQRNDTGFKIYESDAIQEIEKY